MDIVLGVSMTPSAVRMVLVEGENADGASLDHDAFDTPADQAAASVGAPQQVLDAILGTRESAAEGGHRLTTVGVAWTDHAAAAQLRQMLRNNGLEDVLLVSEMHAASALAQAIGQSIGFDRTALLFVEHNTATVAVVRTTDGAVVRVTSRDLPGIDPVTDLQAMVVGLNEGDEPAEAVFMVGSGVDIGALKPHVELATHLPVYAPDDGDLALARGAALASANAPRYEASTVGLYSSEDIAAGATQMAAAGYMAPLGYSAVPDDDELPLFSEDVEEPAEPARKPALLVGSVLSGILVVGVAALAVSLAVVIRPTADQRPVPGDSPVVSNTLAPPAPAQAKEDAAAVAPETIQAPIPVVQEAPRTVVVPPAAPAPAVIAEAAAPAPAAAPEPAAAPAPEAPAPAAPPPAPAAPPPAPAAPAPAPVVIPAPMAPPVVVPVPIVIPPIFQAPSRAPRTPTTSKSAPAPAPAAPAPTTAPAPTNTQTNTPTTVVPTTVPTASQAPSQSSYPRSTPPVTTYPTVTTYPASPSTGSSSSGSQSGSGASSSDSSSSDSGSSSRSRGPQWPLWPFGG